MDFHANTSVCVGLEDECAQFTEVFREVGVNGKRLLGLDYDSLAAMNIIKFGWQECLLHSIQQLESLVSSFPQ